MSTYPICSECGEVLWELAEREAGLCQKCQDLINQEETKIDLAYYAGIFDGEDWRN